jgi:NADPH:quinone reductase
VNATATEYNRYGSTHKQVYIYGGLDRGPDRAPPRLRHGLGRRRVAAHAVPPAHRPRGGPAPARRVAAEITTTFASSYTREVSLAGALTREAIAAYGRQATGEKYLVTPHRGG